MLEGFLIALWPLARIEPVQPEMPYEFAIGDFMLGSENIATDLADPDAPVILQQSRHCLAPDFSAFLIGLSRNTL